MLIFLQIKIRSFGYVLNIYHLYEFTSICI